MINSYYDKFIFTNSLSFRNNNFFLIDIPFVMMPNELIVGLLSHSDSAFNKKIYYSVREAVVKELVKDFRIDFKADGLKAIEVIEQYFSASGWGSIENVQVDKEKFRAIIHVSNNPFASRLFGKSKEPVDHLFRGIFAGLFSVAFEKKMECVELHCVARGEQDCEFVIKEQCDFDVSKKEVQNQLELEA